jgi:hypothetical protein
MSRLLNNLNIFRLEPNYPQITKSIIYELGIETTKKLNDSQQKLESRPTI